MYLQEATIEDRKTMAFFFRKKQTGFDVGNRKKEY